MLREQGKRLLTLSEYSCSLLPLDFETDDCTINQYGVVTDANSDSVFVIQTSPRHFRLMPGPEFSPRLYRRQNGFYDPCVPSIYRNQKPIDIIYWVAKWLELNLSLNEHPACLWLRELEVEGLRFAFDIQGIAQHYGFPTALLDFSRSKDVAMFFATCGYDSKSKTYYPLKSGNAVLYTIDLRGLLLDDDGKSSALPLGLEPLPRPESQKAFALQLLPGENLNSKSWAQRITFDITERESNRYYEMFAGGQALFPSNPFDDHIQALRDSNSVPKPIIEIGIKRGWLPPHAVGIEEAARELRSVGYIVGDSLRTIPPEIVAAATSDWDQRKLGFLSRMQLRGASDHFQA
jgi:hypothetical protein